MPGHKCAPVVNGPGEAVRVALPLRDVQAIVAGHEFMQQKRPLLPRDDVQHGGGDGLHLLLPYRDALGFRRPMGLGQRVGRDDAGSRLNLAVEQEISIRRAAAFDEENIPFEAEAPDAGDAPGGVQ